MWPAPTDRRPRFGVLRRRAAAHVALVDAEGAWVRDPVDGAVRRHPGLAAWIDDHRGCALEVWLGTGLLRHLILGADAPPLHDEAALASYARHQFVHHHGTPAGGWPIAVWRHGAERGAMALQGLDLQALQAQAARQRVRLLGVRAWWAGQRSLATTQLAALRGAPSARLVIVEPHRACCLQLDRGRLVALRARPIDRVSWSGLVEILREDEPAASEPTPAWVCGYGLDGLDEGDARPGWLHEVGRVAQAAPALVGIGA